MLPDLDSAAIDLGIVVREVRPGVRVLMVEDPDGNHVEFAHYADQG